MRAPACGEVDVGDLDEAQQPLALGLLAERKPRGVFGGGEPHRHRPVVPDDPVGLGLGGLDLLGGEDLVEVDRAGVGPEVEAHRPRLEQPVEGGRQHVLAGVLLHVIESPGPVDLAVDGGAGGERPIQHVGDLTVLAVDHLEHGGIAQPPRVERLTARGRIERGAVERHPGPAVLVAGRGDGGVERGRERVGVVEAFGHGRSRRGSGTPASAKPFARSRQLSQRPHGDRSADGS